MVGLNKQDLLEQLKTLFEAGSYKEARSQLENYIAQDPDTNDPDILHQLGIVKQTLRDYPGAVDCFQKVLAVSPQHIYALYNLGMAYAAQGAYEKALDQFRLLEQLTPKSATLFYQIGVVSRILGRLDEAEAALRHALQLNPDYATAYFPLSAMKHYEDRDDADVIAMERILAQGGLSEDVVTKLNFSLAKVYEDLHDYDRAFTCLARGNQLRRQQYRYDVSVHEDYFRRLRETFTAEFFRQRSGYGVRDRTPIFIVGMPRSGTSLVEQILASHPQVYGGGELGDLIRIIMHQRQELSTDFISFLDADDCMRMASQYLAALRQLSATAKYITNKSPLNFQLIGMIRLLFPDARVIHCQRDPMDTCLAIYKQNFTVTHKFAFDLVELGQYYRAYSELMDHWRQVLPGFIYENSYEDLVADQQTGTRSLLEFCGLDWDDACMTFYETQRAVSTASLVQVRRPIYQTSVAKWRKYERHLEPLQMALAGKT